MQNVCTFQEIINTHVNTFVKDCVCNGFSINNDVRSNKPNVYKIGLTNETGNITLTVINRDHEIQVKRHYDIKSAGRKNQISFIYKKNNNNTYTLHMI